MSNFKDQCETCAKRDKCNAKGCIATLSGVIDEDQATITEQASIAEAKFLELNRTGGRLLEAKIQELKAERRKVQAFQSTITKQAEEFKCAEILMMDNNDALRGRIEELEAEYQEATRCDDCVAELKQQLAEKNAANNRQSLTIEGYQTKNTVLQMDYKEVVSLAAEKDAVIKLLSEHPYRMDTKLGRLKAKNLLAWAIVEAEQQVKEQG